MSFTIKELREILNDISTEFDDIEVDFEDNDYESYSMVNTSGHLGGKYPSFIINISKDN